MKKIQMLFVVAMVAVPVAAKAEKVRLQNLPPEVAACVQACLTNAATSGDHVPAACSPDRQVNRRVHNAAKAVAKGKKAKDRVAELQKQVGLLASRDMDLGGEIEKLQQEVETLRKEVRLNLSDWVDLASRTEGELEEIHALLKDLQAKASSPVKIGPQAGFLVLRSSDGTTYTAGLVGPRLTFILTDSVKVLVEGDVLVSAGKAPIGTKARLALGFDFSPNFGLEIGGNAVWAGYNDKLKAKNAFVVGDAALVFRYEKVYGTVGGLIGAEFDQGSAAFAGGGIVTVGLDLP